MDNGFSIRSGAGARRPYAQRDLLPVREVAETELDTPKTAVPADEEHPRRDRRSDDGGNRQDGRAGPDHAMTEVLVDPETQDRLFRERDVRAVQGEHPDQAMLRRRAYGHSAVAGPQPKADIEA